MSIRYGLALALLLAAPPVTLAQSGGALYGLTSCCPNLVVEYDPATGETTPVVEIGDADDAFIATVGSGVLDPATRQLYLVRNGVLIAADLDAGTVTEIGVPDNFSQFAGFDAGRGLIYAFTLEAELIDPPSTIGYTNRLIAIDPSDASSEEIAIIGEGVADDEGYDGDSFSTVSGPAITGTDPFRLFTVRNFQLLTVDLPSGTLTEGTGFAGGQLLAYSAANNSLLTFDQEFEPNDGDVTTGTFSYFVRERSIETGDLLTEIIVGSGEVVDGGTYDGDVYTASLGTAVFDVAGDRIFVNRNGLLVSADVENGNLAEYGGLGTVRLVGSAPVATDAAEGAAASTFSAAAYPNPFREAAQLEVTLDRPQDVTITAFDLLGRRVAVLHRGPLPAGTVALDGIGRSLPAGTYLVRVQGERVQESVRITRVR